MLSILIFSVGYVVYFSTDFDYERDALSNAMIIKDTTKKVNSYYPEGVYLVHAIKYTDFEEFPVLSTDIPLANKIVSIEDWREQKGFISYESVLKNNIKGIDSVEDYIIFGKEAGVTHLVIDGKRAQVNVLNDIFFGTDW